MDDFKLRSDEKKTVLQSQPEMSFNISIHQTSPPKPPPLLQFKRQKDLIIKDSVDQKATEKDVFDNYKENTNGISIQKAILQYPLYTANSLIDYYRQISQPLIQSFLDSLKLQKDYLDVFQPQWVDHMRTTVENYFAFSDKMTFLYMQYCNAYIYNVFDIKNNNNNKKVEKKKTSLS